MEKATQNPRLYTEFADWWPLMSAPADYAEEAALWLKLISEAGFEASTIPFEHSEIEPGTHEIFIGKKSVIP